MIPTDNAAGSQSSRIASKSSTGFRLPDPVRFPQEQGEYQVRQQMAVAEIRQVTFQQAIFHGPQTD